MIKPPRRALRACLHWFGSLVFPDVCLRCGRHAPHHSLCPACLQEASASARSENASPPGLSGIFWGCRLTEPSRCLVHGLKYGGQRRHARFLVDLASAAIPPSLPSDAVLVPVPVHKARRRERGYNQARLLADEWSRRLGHSVCDCLERYRATGSQTHLGAAGRRVNLEKSIRIGRAFRPGKIMVLIDDVSTTGATFSACASVLLAAGAKEVHGLSCVWSPGH